METEILRISDVVRQQREIARAAELLKKDQEALEAWAESELRRREEKGALLDENSRQARDYMQRQLEKK